MADNALTRLPLVGQLALSLVLAGLIGFGFWYLYWSDAVQLEATKTKTLEDLRQDIRVLEVTATKLQEFQREVAIREAKLERLKLILPPEKETPELMRKVQYLAAQSNLQIKKFDPQATVTRDFPGAAGAPAAPAPPPAGGPNAQAPHDTYQEWPINVDLEGTYHNLGMFFDRVGRLARLVNVGNLKIKAQSAQKPSSTIAASCVATTFVYVEASPAPGAPAGQPR
jgi:type IV pilus assembly protein PilO